MFENDWLFTRTESPGFEKQDFDDANWEQVEIPHDWAIKGPFSPENDAEITIYAPTLNRVDVFQHPGRSGGLPHTGKGFYRKHFTLENVKGKHIRVEFDGIMSNSKVYCNGQFAGERPYGYSAFACDLTDLVREGENLLSVSAENYPGASRWYPGGGIYRPARLVVSDRVHIAFCGVRIHTKGNAVFIRAELENPEKKPTELKFVLAETDNSRLLSENISCVDSAEVRFVLPDAKRWQPGAPNLYKLIVFCGNDREEHRFGFRDMTFDSHDGFKINGTSMKFNGVCLHHDLGITGTAVDRDIYEFRLKKLASIGCNAIRTTHNPPDSVLLDLCDELGFLVIAEAFDEWKRPKTPRGYNLFFDDWHEKDLRGMIRRHWNHPCVMMWSIGNEIDEQYFPEGPEVTKHLQDICHEEDPSRPVTAGLNNGDDSITGGLFDVVDIKGFNYKPYIYARYHAAFPDAPVFAAESASTISSRGEYSNHIFEELGKKENLQIDSFDLCNSPGATIPDHEFKEEDENPFVMGEFVWSGFDYLGEPTPYRKEWPSRSSYYGIFDISGMAKDRAYLYKSRWSKEKVLHLMPHWNWEGYEGKKIPVQCYSSYQTVELFVNGKSFEKHSKNPKKLLGTYRHIWSQVPYEPGELRVKAYDNDGNIMDETCIRTAGAPAKLEIEYERHGKMVFAFVSITDSDGNLCPEASSRVDFASDGRIIAADAGDATSLKPFHLPYANAFHGKCAVWIKSEKNISLTVSSVLNGKTITKTLHEK